MTVEKVNELIIEYRLKNKDRSDKRPSILIVSEAEFVQYAITESEKQYAAYSSCNINTLEQVKLKHWDAVFKDLNLFLGLEIIVSVNPYQQLKVV